MCKIILCLLCVISCYSDIIVMVNGQKFECNIVEVQNTTVSYSLIGSDMVIQMPVERLRRIIKASGDTIEYVVSYDDKLGIKQEKFAAMTYYRDSQSPFVGAVANIVPFLPITHIRNGETKRLLLIYALYGAGVLGFSNALDKQNSQVQALASIGLLNGTYLFQYVDGYKSARRYNSQLAAETHYYNTNDEHGSDFLLTIVAYPVFWSIVAFVMKN